MAGRDVEFRLLTPRGPGGVAVVSVVGGARWSAVCRLLDGASDGGLASPPARPRLAVLRIDGEDLDEVLLVDRPAEQSLEIQLHGSPAVLSWFETAVGGFATGGLRRGEALLRFARSKPQLALALEQADLDFDGFLEGLQARPAAERKVELEAALQRSRVALAAVLPRRLVLCGDQNAGKSTLMNRLLFAERVLTGDLPGLTRDPVVEGVALAGYAYEIVDTAGEGEVVASVDRSALDRARLLRRDALRVLVVAGTALPSSSDRAIRGLETLIIRSKADLQACDWPADFCADLEFALADPIEAPRIRSAVGEALRRMRRLPVAGPVGGVAALDGAELARLQAAIDVADGGSRKMT